MLFKDALEEFGEIPDGTGANGMANLRLSCLQVSKPFVLKPCCLTMVAAGPFELCDAYQDELEF